MENTRDFIFLANWYDVIKAYDEAGQKDISNALAKEIIIYGVTGELSTTDSLIGGLVKGMCTAQMKKPYNKGGRPPKYDKSQMLKMRSDGLTYQDIADNLGCSARTVQRALSDDEI